MHDNSKFRNQFGEVRIDIEKLQAWY